MKRGVMMGAAIALVSSAVALVGVARNRTGAPDAEIELSEREAPLGWVEDENSGLSLQVRWEGAQAVLESARRAFPVWKPQRAAKMLSVNK